MGNLSNLYISQSYQSLIHLGTNNALVSGTMTQLQDGVGNSLNFYVDGTNISSSGNIYASNLTSSLPADTASFATTGSNTFVGVQTITGSNGRLVYSGTNLADTSLASIHANDENPWLERFYNDTFSKTNSVMSYFGWNDGRFVFHNDSTQSIGLQVNGYERQNGLLVYSDKVAFINNVEITGSLTASLANGYVWVGNGNNKTTLVATSSFGGGGGVPLTSLNAFTQSIIGTNAWTASVDEKFATIGGQSGSWGGGGSINTSSFATTGSNTFRGNQTLVSSSIAIQGSGTLTFPNGLNFSGNSGDISNITATSTIQLIAEPPEGPGGEGNSIKFINRVANSVIQFDNQQSGAANPINFIGGVANFTLTKVGSSTGKLNINAQGGIDATNSTFTASLANGYVWVGNGSNYTTLVATSSFGTTINTGSFATTGSNSFNGNQIITGSLTSSADIRVNSMTIGLGGGAVSSNVAFGSASLKLNTTGTGNIAIGSATLQSFSATGAGNLTAIGANVLSLLGVSGSSVNALNQNTIIGGSTGQFMTVGSRNTILGALAFQGADYVSRLTGVGRGVFSGIGSSAATNGSGSQYNTAIGHNAAFSLQSGSNNVIIHGGSVGGETWSLGSNNIILGQDANLPATMNNSTIIGRSITGLTSPVSNAVVLADGQGNKLLNRPSLNAITQVSSSLDISGSVSITQTLKLSALDPLPSAVNGTMAVSGSNLYFSSGSSWFKVTLE